MQKQLKLSLLGAALLLLTAGSAAAEDRCGVFPEQQRGSSAREYRNCGECLRHHDRCEERCSDAGYVCTASGYDRRNRLQRVEGDVAEREQRAKKNAEERCQDERLTDCQVERCSEEAGRERVQPCRETAEERPHHRPAREPRRDDPPVTVILPDVPPTQPHVPQQPHVVSWQHVKEQCQGQPYHKIAQQCGNRVGFWHGIRCQVTWSDGRTENLGGKVDLTDPYGRRYCTRDTRPANFNCVSQCDNSPGPLINLPKP